MAKIPSRLEELLPAGAYEKVVDLWQHPDISGKVRDALNLVGLKQMNPLEQVQDAWQQAKTWLSTVVDAPSGIASQWINASGQLFLESTDRLPCIPAVGISWARSSSGFPDRQQCLKRSHQVFQRFSISQSHIWLRDRVSTLQLVCRALGKKILIARADCLRVPGFGDIGNLLSAWDSRVVEVGATNGASVQDWQDALSQNPESVILLVSPTALPAEQAASQREEVLQLASTQSARVVELLIDGCLNKRACQAIGFPYALDRLHSAVDLLVLPADLLLGGAGGMLCVGEQELIHRINHSAERLGCQLDGSSISANLLAIQAGDLEDALSLGAIGGLEINPDNLKNRCQRLAIQLQGLGEIQSAQVIDSQHPLGKSPWNRYQLSNSVVTLRTDDAHGLVTSLKQGSSERLPIMVDISGGAVRIDLRFVPPDDDHQIVAAIRELA